MADSNRIQLTYAPESTFNTHPSSGGDWTALRVLSETFKADVTVASSNEIRAYRDIPALNQTDKGVSGSLSQSLYYDDNATAQLMRYGLGSGAFTGQTTLVSADATTTVQSARSYTVSSIDHAPTVGEWIYVSGAANAATNGYHQIATVGSNTFTVNSAIGADESGRTMTIVQLGEITNGVTFTSHSVERKYTELSNIAEKFSGCAINGFSVDASGQDTVKFSSDWVGVSATSDADGAESVDNAAATTGEMTSINGVQWVREGTGAGSVADMDALGFTFSVSNNLRKQYKLGTLGADGMALGDFVVTGTLQAYFATSALFDKFLNQTATGLAIAISDEATGQGNTYIFDFPNVRFTDGQRVAGGRNQDIIADMSWQAIYNGSSHTMKVAKIASA
mgnify:CR=1 FL=1